MSRVAIYQISVYGYFLKRRLTEVDASNPIEIAQTRLRIANWINPQTIWAGLAEPSAPCNGF